MAMTEKISDEPKMQAVYARLDELTSMKQIPSILTRSGREFIADQCIRAYTQSFRTPSIPSDGEVEAWKAFTDTHRRHFPSRDGTEIEVSGYDAEYRSHFTKVMRLRSPQWNGHAPYILFWRFPLAAAAKARVSGEGEAEPHPVYASSVRVAERYRINMTEAELRAWASDAVKAMRVMNDLPTQEVK